MNSRYRLGVCLLLWLCACLAATAQSDAVEVFQLHHRTAGELAEVVRPLAGADGTVRAADDKLIVRAAPDRIERIRAVLDKIDVAPRELLITVRQGADLRSSSDSAGLSGRVDGGDARVVVPPRRSDDANVIVHDGQGNVVRGGLSSSRSRRTRSVSQRLRVREGSSAVIEVGQSIPVIERRVLPSVGRPVVVERPGYEDVTTGFRVIPRIGGDHFELDIAPQMETLRQGDNSIDVQRLTTTVSGPLGEWVDIGGALQSQSVDDSALLRRGQRNSSAEHSVWIKVEEAP